MAERTGNGGHGLGLVKGATVFGLAVPMIVIVPLVMLMSLSTILVAMVQAQYGTTCGVANASGSTSWVSWAKNIADDDSHGYSQPHRNGNPDYDCSSFVYYALKHAGLDVGSSAFATSGEGAALEKAGFERHDWAKVSDLQTGDIVWSSSHTEIYIGDGRFVGAHHDEDGGVTGPKAGDQTGDEISIDSYAAGYAAYYRYKGSMNVTNSDGSASSAQAVSGSTGSTNVVGMSEKDAEAWFNGQQGPNNLCVAYAYGQCTWWTCMRAKKLGWKNVGQYWGNGQDWARSLDTRPLRTRRSRVRSSAGPPACRIRIPRTAMSASSKAWTPRRAPSPPVRRAPATKCIHGPCRSGMVARTCCRTTSSRAWARPARLARNSA